jgi:hypothetical protein
MRYLSLCSGIEGATVAWHPLGWKPVAFAENEPFASALLSQRFPAIPNLGDITRFEEWPDFDIDLIVAGTPCQGFSIAGLRGGLADDRSNLMLTALRILQRYQPRWFVWENVPGVFSSYTDVARSDDPLGIGWEAAHAGMYSTLSLPEFTATHMPCPNDDVVCSLSDILETGAVPQQYYLSRKACRGILRRADRRGKALPPMLLKALQQVAGESGVSANPEDRTTLSP